MDKETFSAHHHIKSSFIVPSDESLIAYLKSQKTNSNEGFKRRMNLPPLGLLSPNRWSRWPGQGLGQTWSPGSWSNVTPAACCGESTPHMTKSTHFMKMGQGKK